MSQQKETIWSKDFIYSWIANFLMGFSFYLLLPTLPFYLIDQFHANETLIGIIIASYTIAALAIRPFSGFVVDRFPRKLVYVISYLLFVSFYAGYFIAGTIIFILFLRIMHGFTWGVITTSGNTLAIDITPAQKRGQAVGFYGLALNISMALSPVIGIFIYEHFGHNALFLTALLTSVVGLIFSLLIKVKHKHEIKPHEPLSLDRFLLVKGIPVGINLILAAVSYGMVLSFAALYGKSMGAQSGIFYMLLATGIGVARIFSGKLIDNGRINQITTIGLCVLAASFAGFALFAIPMVYYSLALSIGLGYGICYPAFQTMIINIAPHTLRGTANSTYYTAFDIGVGAGMFFAGKIASMSSLSVSFGVCALIHVCAVVYFIKISVTNYDKNKLV